MICPHCRIAFHNSAQPVGNGADADGHWQIMHQLCPNCNHSIIEMQHKKVRRLLYPRVALRPSPPTEVPRAFAEDYIEASLVIDDSPKASSALSRRCLQNVLREKGGVKHGNLYDEIEEVIKSGNLPSAVADGLHAVRQIGNFAAHPIKSTSSGEIQPVEAGEAEWNLDVLDSVFDHYFVAPAKAQARLDALNAKLLESGKKPIAATV